MKPKTSKVLLKDLRELIATARQDVARQVNSALVLLYWRIGKRIRQDILKEKRAEYGEQILPTLSAELMKDFGPGFTARNLANMVRFAEVFPDEKILHTVCAKLSWSHFRLIIYLEEGAIRVASYWTKVLPRKLLQKKLHEVIQHARTRLAQMEPLSGKKLLSK